MKKDKKVLLNVAVLAVGMTAGIAQAADVQVYGRAHLSGDVLGDGSDYGLNVSSNSSRFGVRASHEIAPGLEAFVQLEQSVRFDQGGGNFATRDSFAGVRGDWGQLRVGQFDTPGKVLRARVDVFNDRLGDLRNLSRNPASGADFDTRFKNSVHYRSPNMSGMVFDIQYSPHHAEGGTTDNDRQALSMSVGYTVDKLWLGASFERAENVQLDPTALRLGATYNATGSLQLLAFFQDASDLVGGDRQLYGGGFKNRFGDYAFMAQLHHATENDLDDTAATMLSVGMDYYLSSNFTLYGIVGITDNDDRANYRVSAGGRDTSVTPGLGNRASGLSVGFLYNF